MNPTTSKFARSVQAVGLAGRAIRAWKSRQILVAATGAVLVGALVGFATVLIPNSIFARDIAPVWWNYPVWIVTSVLMGMLMATYVSVGSQAVDADALSDSESTRTSRMGAIGGVLAWFAVGCPVCNKIALVVLGYSGAITWFAPFQPVLAILALFLTGVALVWRLRGQVACSVPAKSRKVSA